MADKQPREVSATDFGKIVGTSKMWVSKQIRSETNLHGALYRSVRIDEGNKRVYIDLPTGLAEWRAAGMKMKKDMSEVDALIKENGWEPNIPTPRDAAFTTELIIDKPQVEEDDEESVLETIDQYKDFGSIPSTTNVYEAERRKAVAEAGIKELNFLKLKDSLVNKADVYRSLFEFGQQMSVKIQQIPERIAPYIRSAIPDPLVAHEIIEKLRQEIEDFQVAFSNGPNDSDGEEPVEA